MSHTRIYIIAIVDILTYIPEGQRPGPIHWLVLQHRHARGCGGGGKLGGGATKLYHTGTPVLPMGLWGEGNGEVACRYGVLELN